ncbi:MAG: hypothetical protein M0R06_22560 [Sphaerochaeta sp.]|jgi:hypothetical protein|nr:hypothetical protein [Dehalococcoidia bacterium]MCK9601844.1 hypothetical protein [Sphaerochaeta sp.]MDD5533490.1 hypothetical protein [Syntrophales bacterium]
MAEKKTLSKVETYALLAGREKIAIAEAEMRALIDDVAAAHGVNAKKDGDRWQFTPDFSAMVLAPPAPKPGSENNPGKKNR